MLITVNDLRKVGTAPYVIQQFRNLKKESLEVLDFIHFLIKKEQYADAGFILEQFITDKTERDNCLQNVFLVTNGHDIYKSYKVDGSSNVFNSNDVLLSDYIFYSNEIESSHHIYDSSSVKDSFIVFDSTAVTSSNKVAKSIGVSNSENIIRSEFITNSSNVIYSWNVFNSSNIYMCKQTKKSFFCSLCENLKYSLFCWGAGGDHLLFNKPYDPEEYDAIVEQYKFLVKPLDFYHKWPTEEVVVGMAFMGESDNRANFYKTQTASFWKWVKSLPNYDERILQSVTGLQSF